MQRLEERRETGRVEEGGMFVGSALQVTSHSSCTFLLASGAWLSSAHHGVPSLCFLQQCQHFQQVSCCSRGAQCRDTTQSHCTCLLLCLWLQPTHSDFAFLDTRVLRVHVGAALGSGLYPGLLHSLHSNIKDVKKRLEAKRVERIQTMMRNTSDKAAQERYWGSCY